jgi:hypothetical protein
MLSVASMAMEQPYSTKAGQDQPQPPVKVTGKDQPEQIYQKPYVDTDEWRDKPHRHRYVHGGFNGTEHLFSFYFPPVPLYQGRFFQGLPAVPGNENAMLEPTQLGGVIDDIMPFAVETGGYVVESNQGYKTMLGTGNPAKANAVAATLSREVAPQVYGYAHRPFAYVFGGSGAGYKTISSIETTEAFDGGGAVYYWQSGVDS